MKIIVNGACGRMGREIIASANASGVEIAAAVDKFGTPDFDIPFYKSIEDVKESADAVIDFTHHTAVPEICAYVRKTGTPCVVASTGHTESELSMLKALSNEYAVFYSRNMSLGINLLIDLCKSAVKAFGGDCDIEIIEKHHRNKLDAPSGTALMIAEGIAELMPEGTDFVTERASRRMVRPNNEIGISSIRCGGIFGEHEVLLSRNGETVSLKHTAESRALFAEGALKAASYIVSKKNGMYSMKDLLAESVKNA
ncbi:MAG: 4-hydroxy-tetrahydrodipicolinate reductase [Clostridia bacterium]|nr:4-hydroxy-tetrahydrodipicolinate reductase [Clostridia bacterium]